MRLTVLIIVLLFTSKSYAQSDLDSLKKYSYLFSGIYIYNGAAYPAGGSCFFIKKAGRFFLITARHVVDGCENKKLGLPYADLLTVFLRDTNGNINDTFIGVPIKRFQNIAPCPDTINTDIIAIEVKDKNTYKLNTVEGLLKDRFKEAGDIELYGFPASSYRQPVPHSMQLPLNVSHIHVDNKDNTWYSEWKYHDTTHIDSSYLTIVNDKIPVDDVMSGYSGSPLFLKEKNTNRIRVLGAFAMSVTDKINLKYRSWKIPVIEEALRQIDILLKD